MTFLKKIIISSSFVFLYSFIFEISYKFIGDAAAAFSFLPAIAFGWLFMIKGGVLYGILSIPINLLLFSSVGNSINSHFLPSTAAGVSFMVVGCGVGWLKYLIELVKIKSEELEKERVSLKEEIERRTRAEELLTYEALHDPLTNLANRRLLYNRIEHALAWSKRNLNNLSSLVYLDLNKFKPVNDIYGHKAGDILLKEVSRRIKSMVREIDTVSRMGGDEFAILLEAEGSEKNAIAIIRRIQGAFEKPFFVENISIEIGTSIGVVINISDYEQIEDIVKDADFAMYYAKAHGMEDFKIYDPSLRESKDLQNLTQAQNP